MRTYKFTDYFDLGTAVDKVKTLEVCDMKMRANKSSTELIFATKVLQVGEVFSHWASKFILIIIRLDLKSGYNAFFKYLLLLTKQITQSR